MIYKIIEILRIKIFYRFFKIYRYLKLGDIDLKQLINFLPQGSVVVEVGANKGQHTRCFYENKNIAKVICFEPDQQAATIFLENHFDNKVVFLKMAISDEKTTKTWYHSYMKNSEWSVSSSLSKPKKHRKIYKNIHFESNYKVNVDRLDRIEVIKGLEEIQLLFLDVQGEEYKVLQGSLGIMNKIRYIYMEYSIFKLYDNSVPLKYILKQFPNLKVNQIFQNDVLLENINFIGKR